MEPWPLDRMKRSRSAQFGLFGLCFRWSFHSTSAISAIPIGAPGWPELAFCTASMLNARIAFAKCLRVAIIYVLLLKKLSCPPFDGTAHTGYLLLWAMTGLGNLLHRFK